MTPVGLDQYSLLMANKLLTHFDLNRRRVDIQKTTRDGIQKIINDWILMRFGKQEKKDMNIESGMIGYDPRTAAILVGCGMNLVHCISSEDVKQESWDENFKPIPIDNTVQVGISYYPNLNMNPMDKKQFYEANSEYLLLGNGAIHESSRVQPDFFTGIGSVVGPFSWIGPNCQIGNMATISSHASFSYDVIIGDYCTIGENVSIHSGARIGAGCTIGSGAVIFRGVTIEPGVVVQPCQIVRTSLKNGGLRNVKF